MAIHFERGDWSILEMFQWNILHGSYLDKKTNVLLKWTEKITRRVWSWVNSTTQVPVLTITLLLILSGEERYSFVAFNIPKMFWISFQINCLYIILPMTDSFLIPSLCQSKMIIKRMNKFCFISNRRIPTFRTFSHKIYHVRFIYCNKNRDTIISASNREYFVVQCQHVCRGKIRIMLVNCNKRQQQCPSHEKHFDSCHGCHSLPIITHSALLESIHDLSAQLIKISSWHHWLNVHTGNSAKSIYIGHSIINFINS